MPVCSLHLLSLSSSLSQFLAVLSKTSVKPLTVAKVIRWIILPSTTSTSELLARNTRWDVLLVLPDTNPLPAELADLVTAQWTVKAGIPSRIIKEFETTNKNLLNPNPKDIPRLTGALDKPIMADSAQTLSLSAELQAWIQGGDGKAQVPGAVSMLNLLAFKAGMKDSYLKYGKAFAESIGSSRGGNAKIVGHALETDGLWDEVAIAHYPSIEHFGDMIASQDYQAVNQKYRVPALRDTFILCTSELGLPWPGARGNSAKL